MSEALTYIPVGTPNCELIRRGKVGRVSYEGQWVGRASLDSRQQVGCQQFVDVLSPLGRLAPIGIVGLILADNNVPFDWVSFLFPLVHSDTSPFPGFADPEKIKENRAFIRYACKPGSDLIFNYSDPTGTRWFEISNPFVVSELERKEEILGILNLLDRREPFFVEAALTTAMQEAMFGTANWIANRLGHQDFFF